MALWLEDVDRQMYGICNSTVSVGTCKILLSKHLKTFIPKSQQNFATARNSFPCSARLFLSWSEFEHKLKIKIWGSSFHCLLWPDQQVYTLKITVLRLVQHCFFPWQTTISYADIFLIYYDTNGNIPSRLKRFAVNSIMEMLKKWAMNNIALSIFVLYVVVELGVSAL